MDSFDEIEVNQIIRRLDNTLYKDDYRNKEIADLGGFVYLFPLVNIL